MILQVCFYGLATLVEARTIAPLLEFLSQAVGSVVVPIIVADTAAGVGVSVFIPDHSLTHSVNSPSAFPTTRLFEDEMDGRSTSPQEKRHSQDSEVNSPRLAGWLAVIGPVLLTRLVFFFPPAGLFPEGEIHVVYLLIT